MDRRAIACIDQALADAELADDSTGRQVLHGYFDWATTTTMAPAIGPPTTCLAVSRLYFGRVATRRKLDPDPVKMPIPPTWSSNQVRI
jgi:hypothetical protein